MTIAEMLAERKRLMEEAKALQATADDENRSLTEEEEATITSNVDKADELAGQIEAARTAEREATERQAAIRNRMATANAWENQPQPQQTRVPPLDSPAVHTPGRTDSQSNSAGRATFPTFGEQLQAVAQAADGRHPTQWDNRLVPSAAASGMNESVGSQGGFLVGTDENQELLQRTYANSQILNGGAGYTGPRRIPISGNSNGVKFNALDESSRADGSRAGGIQAYWKEEAALKDGTTPTFREVELNLRKLIGLYYATDELLQDTAALEAVVLDWFAQEFAFKIQDALINGTGALMPLGILPSTCLVSQAKQTGQAAATIVKENIDKMWSRMWTNGIGNSVWHINQQCYPALFDMEQAVGTGGLPVFLPPGGLSVSPYGTLMGRPIVPLEQCQALGTEGDILFCDWSQMYFADKGGIQAASSIHVRFIYDESTFRFVYRCDAQPSWNLPLTPFKGGATATTGPFLSLDTR